MNTQSKRGSSFRRSCKSVLLLTVLSSLGLMSVGLPARAADEGEVAVGGEHVLTIYFPAGGLSVKQRADKVTERLVNFLGDPNLKPTDIQAAPNGKSEAKITIKGKLFYTVDAQTAKRENMTPLKAAQHYADMLRAVLPKVNVKPNPGRGA